MQFLLQIRRFSVSEGKKTSRLKGFGGEKPDAFFSDGGKISRNGNKFISIKYLISRLCALPSDKGCPTGNLSR
jgi:hypothetical protein